jgi:hypothetical protein
MLCILFFNQLSAQCSLEDRYWTIRKRLNEHFVKNDYESLKDGYDDLDGIGTAKKDEKGNFIMPIIYTKAGYGMPAAGYNMATNSTYQSGDATAAQGNYFAMLATEYKLLQNTGDATNAQKTLDELFLSLQAVRRLDMSANQFILEQGKKQGDMLKDLIPIDSPYEPCVNPDKVSNNVDMTSGYSGFFYRNDMPWGFDMPNNTVSNWGGGDWSSVESVAKDIKNGYYIPNGNVNDGKVGSFTSIDQIYGLIYGLSMVKTMIPNPTTPEEIKVIDTVDKMMVGLIAQGMHDLDLVGCFEDKGKIQGQWTFPFQNKLYDIAKQFGLDDEVDKIVPNAGIKAALSGLASFDDLYKTGCIPNNSFQINNYLRLFSVNPQDFIKSPGSISPLFQVIGVFKNDLVVVGNISEKFEKYSYGLSAALMNGDNDGNNKIDKVLDKNCQGMKDKLATAPCCGPNIGITNFPKTNNIDHVAISTSEINWLVGDSNDGGIECFTESEKFGKEPIAWNGIDYLLDYNLMLLACEQEVKSGDWHLPNSAPTLVQPNPLKSSSGCEDDKFFLHIKGPEEVCAGSDVNFSLSTADGRAPWYDGKWTGGGVVKKQLPPDPKDPKERLSETEKANFMQTFTDKIPTNLANGATYTVNYGFRIWSSDGVGKGGLLVNKTVSKTVKVVNQKPAQVVLSTTEEPCFVTVKVSCSTCPGGFFEEEIKRGTANKSRTFTSTNACGTSETTITIPKADGNCNHLPKQQNDEKSNVKLEINVDTYNFISIKTDRTYYKSFDCRLIDLQGRTITNQKYNDSNISLDVSTLDLLSGIYIFQIITNDGQVWSKKFVYTTE